MCRWRALNSEPDPFEGQPHPEGSSYRAPRVPPTPAGQPADEIYELVNTEILEKASGWLAERGLERILTIVDQLDRVPQKLLNGHRITNRENLVLDHAGTLRALNCDVLHRPDRAGVQPLPRPLQGVYGGKILTLLAITIRDREGEESPAGLARVARGRGAAGRRFSTRPLTWRDRTAARAGGGPGATGGAVRAWLGGDARPAGAPVPGDGPAQPQPRLLLAALPLGIPLHG